MCPMIRWLAAHTSLRARWRAAAAVVAAGAVACARDATVYDAFARDVERTGDSALVVIRDRAVLTPGTGVGALDSAAPALEREAAAFAILLPPDSLSIDAHERMRAGLDSVVVALRTLRDYLGACARGDTVNTTPRSCADPTIGAGIRGSMRRGVETYLAGRRALRDVLGRHDARLDRDFDDLLPKR